MKPSELRLDPPLSRPHGGAYQMELDGRGLLTLFLALAVVCGMFFAFGYTIGKHAVPANFTLGSAQTSASNAAPGAGPTVPPGVQPPNPKDLSSAEANQTPSTLTPDASTSAAAAAAPNSTATNSTVAGPPVAPNTANNTPPGEGVFQVQVFAGGQADANSLASALKARGYPANVVAPAANASDDLYRVQVGPYLTSAEAQAMRSRLTADGYQAVVKQ